jgi:hypothetical protein
MAIRADNIALCHLVKNCLPITHADPGGNGEVLAVKVVELKDDRVGLAAVGAGMRAEELEQKRRTFGDERILPTRRGCNVPLAICDVVGSFVGGATRPAVCVEFPESPTVPGKLRGRLQLTAAAAPLALLAGRHEHTFPWRADGSWVCAGASEVATPLPHVAPPRGRRRIGGYGGEWRSLVAHPAGGRAVAGSNPVSPIEK